MVAGAAFLVVGAAATAYPVQTPGISSTPAKGSPSHAVSVTVTNCQVGEMVDFDLPATPSSDSDECDPVSGDGFLSAIDYGIAVANLTAPGAVGNYQGTAYLNETDQTLYFNVVVEAETGAPTPSLPPTGSNSNQMVPIAVGLIVAGAGLVGVAAIRRRRLPA